MKTTKPKKRNPRDNTDRNARASLKRDQAIMKRVRALEEGQDLIWSLFKILDAKVEAPKKKARGK